MPTSHSVSKQTVLNVCPPAIATHDWNLLHYIAIALSMNSWSKSFCNVNKTVFYLGITLASFGVSLLVFQHGTTHMIIHCHIQWQFLDIPEISVIFTSELQFSYWFT